MKAQAMFGGTKPHDHAVKVKQVGSTGSITSKTGHIEPKVTVKQAKSSPTSTSITRKTRATQVGTTGSR
jgi:hypothetical protein